MKKYNIRRLIAIQVPLVACNLKCHYCYLSQAGGYSNEIRKFDPSLVGKALSKKRLGGICIINLTGTGETLIPPEMPEVIKKILEQGHFVEVVTNGTLTKRFDEIAIFPHKLLEHLEFKFSFHYMELIRLDLLDTFFENVNKMRSAGCSITVELMPNDEAMIYAEEIKKVCTERVGAWCHLTMGRDDKDDRKLLTSLSEEDYKQFWDSFDSEMFRFKSTVFNVRRKEFCYAGCWSLHVDLATGEAQQCYDVLPDQNIYEHLERPLYFRPIGHHCKQPYCYNAHAFMALGVIPKIETPTYAAIRDRIDLNGDHWLNEKAQIAFSEKLVDANGQFSALDIIKYYLTYPFYLIRLFTFNLSRIGKKIKKIKG